MDIQKQNQRFIPIDYDIFGGLDVDKKSIATTFVDHGILLKSMNLPYDCKNLLNYTKKHFKGKRVAFAYEAGPTGFGLYDELTTLGYTCLVAAPSMIPRVPGQRVKTNRLDSKKIAESLRGGQLKSIHVPEASYRNLRHLIKLRDNFVKQAVANKCRIKALLLLEGIDFPEAPQSSQWSSKVIGELKELPLEGAISFKMNSLLSNLEFAKQKVLETIGEIRRFCKEDEEINRCVTYLTSIPGIGPVLATHLLARIGDYRNLKNARQIGAFLGLSPMENSTGDNVNRGPITRIGDARLRNKLIQGAWTAIRIDPDLREFYLRIYQRNPRNIAAKKAIVAVGRKLTGRIYAVLKEQRFYDIKKDNALDEDKALSSPLGTTRLNQQNLEIASVL